MSRSITEHAMFRPRASKAETKADITDHAARAIIGDEAARREAKTAKLRQARLENEAKQTTVPAPAKLRPKKAASARQEKFSA